MRKLFLGLITLAALQTYAQDMKSVKKALDVKDLAKAQQEVDAWVAKDEKKADAWYWKHKVYASIAESEAQKGLVANPLKTGFEAYKKFISLDKQMKAMIADNVIDFTTIPSYYRGKFVNIGGQHLDAKNYQSSYENLKDALEVFDFMVKEKLTTATLDTSIVFYTGYAAMNAKNNEATEVYYKKLVDAKAKATDLQIAYGWMANYYMNEKKEAAKGDEYLKKGLEVYPADEYLLSLKTNAVLQSGDWNAIFAQDEAKIATSTDYKDYLAYAANLFDYVYTDQKVNVTDKAAKAPKLDEMLAKCLQLKPNSAEANFLSGMNATQKTIELDKTMKALKKNSTPENLAKVKKLNAEKMVLADAAIKNFDLVNSLYRSKGENLKPEEKERYKTVLNNLIYFYQFKKMDDRAKEYGETLKALK